MNELGLVDEVKGSLSAPTLAVLAAPPPETDWSDHALIDEIFLATEEACGRTRALQLVRRAQEVVVPVGTSLHSGLLGMFGVSPALLFGQLSDSTRRVVDGAFVHWTPTGTGSGSLEIAYDRPFRSAHLFQMFIPAIELVFELCCVDGVVSEPYVMSLARARFQVRW